VFKITIRASGVRSDVGAEAAHDIETEFRERRTWHERVTCSFADGKLTLIAFNDFDPKGLALSDEFSDCLSALIPLGGISDDSSLEIVAVQKVRAGS
jgi:hypothetical protein